MKRVGFVFALAVIALVVSGSAMAQDADSYFVTYYSNNVTGAPDAVARFINDGYTGNDIWASFYVFDDSQELVECCGCDITADGLLSEDVKTELTANPLTHIVPTRGVIKVIASSVAPGTIPIDSTGVDFWPFNNTPTPGLHGYATHIQTVKAATYAVTEGEFLDGNLNSAEQTALQMLCYYDKKLSGKPCICTPEDSDF
jgi:hypothetical protein